MMDKLQQQVLAILFASGDAIEGARIAQAAGAGEAQVAEAADALQVQLDQMGMPFTVLKLEGRYQLCSREEFAPIIQKALEVRRSAPLSQAALEVLSVVAYNQPVTRAFVEQVRGVDSTAVIGSLQEKKLIEEAGRMDLPGHPIAYVTTPDFLRCFGLESLEELPPVPQELPPREDGQVEFEELLQTQDG